MEEQFGAAAVELDVAELVDGEQLDFAVAGDESSESSFVGGLDEFVDELRAGCVADAAALLAGGSAESDEEVGFAALRVGVGTGDPRSVPGVRSRLRFL